MKKLVLFIISATLISASLSSTAHAENKAKLDNRQQLIQEQMTLLAKAQNLMQLEIQSHFKRAQAIQNYQMCIQAGVKKDDFRMCKMQLKKDQSTLDQETASLRKMQK